MPSCVSLPMDAGAPTPPLLSRRLADNKRLLFLAGAALFFVFLTLSSPPQEYAHKALAQLRNSAGQGGAVLLQEGDEGGVSWRKTSEEEELQTYRWQAEPDESLKRAVAGLNQHDTRVRNWLRSTRPISSRGTFIGYSSPVSPVPHIAQGPPAQQHTTLPRSWEGPGNLEGGSVEKYAELLKEWYSGRQSTHDEMGHWQEDYKALHDEIMRGERETRLLEYHCENKVECGGLADRMLGMTTTFIIALLTKRAFVATWDRPIPLSLLFDSPNVDWSEPPLSSIHSYSPEEGGRPLHVLFGNGTLVAEREALAIHNFKVEDANELLVRMRTHGKTSLLDKSWIRLERPNRGIALQTFSNRALLPQLASLGLTSSSIYAQLVHFLFRPKLEVLSFINEYTSLFALPSVFAVGIQIRTGDAYMRNPELDAVNTVERHQHWFDCAAEVVETYAAPTARPLFFLITDSATLRASAASAYPDRVIVSGLLQRHNELRDDQNQLLHVTEEEGRARSVGEMKEELDGLQNTVAESWIFESMDFALLSHHSGFGKIPTFMHATPNRAIVLPRVREDLDKPDDPTAFIRPSMPSCRLETTLASFSDLASGWSLG
ncbi:hypothetical protein JCM6882_007829 [Rhodosporidiobolus microsporus]